MEVEKTLLGAFIGGVLGASSKEFVSLIFRQYSRRQSELDAIEALLLQNLGDIRDHALDYWGSSAKAKSSPINEGKILGQLHYCASLYPELFKSSLGEKRATDMLFVKFRATITGGDFGSKGRKPQTSKFSEIELATYQLKSQIKLGRIRDRRLIKNFTS